MASSNCGDEKQEKAKNTQAKTDTEKIKNVEKLLDTAKSTQENVLANLKSAAAKNTASQITPLYIVNAVSAKVTKETALSLAKTPGVAQVILDRKVNATPLKEAPKPQLQQAENTAQPKHVPWNLAQIGITEALQNKYAGDGVTVGIIDSGNDSGHVWGARRMESSAKHKRLVSRRPFPRASYANPCAEN